MPVSYEFVAEVDAVDWIKNRKVARVSVPNARIGWGGPTDIFFHLPADGFHVGQRVRIILSPEGDNGDGIEWT